MISLITLLAATQETPYQLQDFFSVAQSPKKIKPLLKSSFPVVVLFVKDDCEPCASFQEKMKVPVQRVTGIAPTFLINCDKNNSAEFCKEMKVKRFPTMKLMNQKDDEPLPAEWDMDDALTEKDFVEFIYEHRKNIFSVSSKIEALLKYIEDGPKSNVSILYLTKGVWPQLFMNRVSVHFMGRADNIHQPSYNDEAQAAFQSIPGAETLTANKNQIAVFSNGKITAYTGEMAEKPVIDWIEATFLGKAQEQEKKPTGTHKTTRNIKKGKSSKHRIQEPIPVEEEKQEI